MAAELNNLGVKQTVENGAAKQSSHFHHPLDSSDDDDDEDEEDDNNSGNSVIQPGAPIKRQPNDGTLLASDPPKPL